MPHARYDPSPARSHGWHPHHRHRAAINYWRDRSPSPDGITLEPELRALAEVYALMIYYREDEADESRFPPKAKAAWLAWYATTPDTPCIAICSTSQGDANARVAGAALMKCSAGPR
jgi:hypothetical protein